MELVCFYEHTFASETMDTVKLRQLKLLVIAAGIAAIGATYASSVFASHSFEAGVRGDSLPDNTHIRLDGLTLPPGGVLPLYDSSPNFVAGHFLLSPVRR
jgi:hypothetical protein